MLGTVFEPINVNPSAYTHTHKRVFSNTTVQKHQLFDAQPSFKVQLSHLYVIPGNIIALTIQTFVGQMVSLLFNAGLIFFNVD